VRRLADTILKGQAKNLPNNVTMLWAVVAAVHTSPHTVDLNIFGSSVTVTGVRYDATYSPTVGDVVYGRIIGTDLLVEGKLAT
jgi:hypothetical protein